MYTSESATTKSDGFLHNLKIHTMIMGRINKLKMCFR